jgi:hypothetical protein
MGSMFVYCMHVEISLKCEMNDFIFLVWSSIFYYIKIYQLVKENA